MHFWSLLVEQVWEIDGWRRSVFRLINDRDGVTAIEYGLIAAFIALAIVVILGNLGTDLSSVFDEIAENL